MVDEICGPHGGRDPWSSMVDEIHGPQWWMRSVMVDEIRGPHGG